MARSIGRHNVALVKRITREEITKTKQQYFSIVGSPNYSGIEDSVIERLPKTIWDSYECAESEILRIIQDTIAKAL